MEPGDDAQDGSPDVRGGGVGGRLGFFAAGLAIGLIGGVGLAGAKLPAGHARLAGVAPAAHAAAPKPAQTPVPVAASSAPVVAPAPAAPKVAPFAGLPLDHKLTVGVFGDSMADGLWSGLYRHMRDGKSIDVVRFSRPSTGLTRYDYVDVQTQTEQQLATRKVDVAVVLFGTNDEQGIFADKKVYRFGSPEWRAVYTARIDTLVATFRRNGAQVYWVGLPKMERPGFDQGAGALNTIFEERMRALGVPYVSTVEATVDATGAYAAYLPGASGQKQLIRARDGIHMTPAGYLRFSTPVAARIRADLATALAARPAPVQAAAHAAEEPAQAPVQASTTATGGRP